LVPQCQGSGQFGNWITGFCPSCRDYDMRAKRSEFAFDSLANALACAGHDRDASFE
jgi:hypothetical protein